MGRGVDGFVLPVPKRSRAAYMRKARLGRKAWPEQGALEYHECVADDVKACKVASFPQSVKLKKDEEVWFSWIEYKSRRDRHRIMGKVMTVPRMTGYDPKKRSFNGKRVFSRGLKVMVSS